MCLLRDDEMMMKMMMVVVVVVELTIKIMVSTLIRQLTSSTMTVFRTGGFSLTTTVVRVGAGPCG